MVSSAAEFASDGRPPARPRAGRDRHRSHRPGAVAAGAHGLGGRGPARRGPAPDRRDHGQHLGLARPGSAGAAPVAPCSRAGGGTAPTAGRWSSTLTGGPASRSAPAAGASRRSPSARCPRIPGPWSAGGSIPSPGRSRSRPTTASPMTVAPFDAGREPATPDGAGTEPGPAAARRRAPRRRARPPISTASSRRRRCAPAVATSGSSAPGRWARVAAAASLDRGPHGLDGRCVNGPLRGGHRAPLERGRPRLALRRRPVRGDAFPLRRDRRPRLGAEPRARASRAGLRERRLRRDPHRRRVRGRGSLRRPPAAPAPSRPRTPSCSRPSPTSPTPASAMRPRRLESPRPEDRWVAEQPAAQPLRPLRRRLSASTRRRPGVR